MTQALPQFGTIHLDGGCKFEDAIIFSHTFFVFHLLWHAFPIALSLGLKLRCKFYIGAL